MGTCGMCQQLFSVTRRDADFNNLTRYEQTNPMGEFSSTLKVRLASPMSEAVL